ncbi:MAG: hypothetical protein E6Q85_08290 [Thiothrix sp.]|nr:MAG: hypothetical protein E6Q85_08290 [Thiothrix sp.]
MKPIILLLGFLGLVANLALADTNSLLPVQDAIAAEAPVDADSKKLMQELCESYADDEGLKGAARDSNIKDCLASMTTDLSDMETTASSSTEPIEQPVDENASHPEVLIANELVEKPLPGVEELVPKTPLKTE